MKYMIKIINKYGKSDNIQTRIKSTKQILKDFTILNGEIVEIYQYNSISDRFDILINKFELKNSIKPEIMILYKDIVVGEVYNVIEKGVLNAYVKEYGTYNILKVNKKDIECFNIEKQNF